MRALILILIAASLAACASAPPKKPPAAAASKESAQAPAKRSADLAAYDVALTEILRLEEADKHVEARALVARQIGREDFDALPTALQHKWLHLSGLQAVEARDFEQAHLMFLLTSKMPDANTDDWNYRFISAQMTGDRTDATLALTTIAQRWPEKLRTYDSRVVNNLLFGQPRSDDAARFDLLRALYSAHWKLEFDFEPSHAWADLARMLLDRGEVEEATQVTSRITSPRGLLALRVDKRFDAVVRAAPERFDVEAAMTREIAHLEKVVAQSPRSLQIRYELIFAYLDAAQYQRALSLAQSVLASASAAAYDDYDDEINWILDARAEALQRLGRWREAQRDYEKAAAHTERGAPNVSNVINLAMLHAELGHSRQALTTLGDMVFDTEGVSPYGGMQIHRVLLLSALANHDDIGIEGALDYMRDNQSAAPATFQTALLSANKIDEAASVLIHRLQDPALRAGALTDMQEYRQAALTATDRTVQRRWQQLKARSDVQAALAQVGRIERFSLSPEFR